METYYTLKWTNKFGKEIKLEYIDEPYLYKLAETLILEGKHILCEKQ